MKVYKLKELSAFGTNCYLVVSEQGNGALIDAPDEPEYIINFASEKGCQITKILLTHGHCDHIGAAGTIQKKTNCKVYIHENDKEKLYNDVGNLTAFFGLNDIIAPTNIILVNDGDQIELDEISFEVIHTPGHTSGGVCYVSENEMFSGDTLFRLSIGRTDMPDGNYSTLAKSLEKLSKLKKNYTIHPGHMEETHLDFEKQNNPYLR